MKGLARCPRLQATVGMRIVQDCGADPGMARQCRPCRTSVQSMVVLEGPIGLVVMCRRRPPTRGLRVSRLTGRPGRSYVGKLPLQGQDERREIRHANVPVLWRVIEVSQIPSNLTASQIFTTPTQACGQRRGRWCAHHGKRSGWIGRGLPDRPAPLDLKRRSPPHHGSSAP